MKCDLIPCSEQILQIHHPIIHTGTDLSKYAREGGQELDPAAGPYKIAFDGCGITNGISGVLFASGLGEQCDYVCAIIRDLLRASPQDPYHVCTNCLGLSRGGLASMILAQKIAALPADTIARIDLNLCLFDPVPGNLVSTGVPFTGWGRADLSACSCLRRVLAIYPHEPLPALSFHAPVLCKYPACAQVEEDVFLGCHQGALLPPRMNSLNEYVIVSNLSFHRLLSFLALVGTEVDVTSLGYFPPSTADCLQIYRRELELHVRRQEGGKGDGVLKAVEKAPDTCRAVHDGCGWNRVIVRRTPSLYGSSSVTKAPPTASVFMNIHHEMLERGSEGRQADDSCMNQERRGVQPFGLHVLRIESSSVWNPFC